MNKMMYNYYYPSIMDNLSTFSTEFHASREDPTNHPIVLAEYANSDPIGAINIIFDT
jgi:hypothetical protein